MNDRADYTTLAYRYTARYPFQTYLVTQINFWIIANILLVTLFNVQSHIIGYAYQFPISGRYGTMLWIAVVLGIVYGMVLGSTSYHLEKKFFQNKALGKVILLKTFISLILLVLILALIRYVLFDHWISPYLPEYTVNKAVWPSLFLLLVIYYFTMTLLISFINLINKKYGPGVLVPMLFGRFREPREEDRIFMFMDLKSSTSTAEELGHLKYSAFIRDCFTDINAVLYPYRAQVYQYVGDEIVVTWPESEGLKEHYCILFYFACQRQFKSRSKYYLANYGFLPHFKAGIHAGKVTAVEIGEFKREIAYHGDILNSASRIQGVCNEYKKNFLVSKSLFDKLSSHPNIQAQNLGTIALKGKLAKVEVMSLEWVGQEQ